MQSILEEFACGKISPFDGSYRKDSRYEHTLKSLCEVEDKLMSALDDQSKEMLRQFMDLQEELSLTEGIDKFIYGYRLGVLMTVEVFSGRNEGGSGSECT